MWKKIKTQNVKKRKHNTKNFIFISFSFLFHLNILFPSRPSFFILSYYAISHFCFVIPSLFISHSCSFHAHSHFIHSFSFQSFIPIPSPVLSFIHFHHSHFIAHFLFKQFLADPDFPSLFFHPSKHFSFTSFPHWIAGSEQTHSSSTRFWSRNTLCKISVLSCAPSRPASVRSLFLNDSSLGNLSWLTSTWVHDPVSFGSVI